MKKECNKCFVVADEKYFVMHSKGMRRNTCIICWKIRDKVYTKRKASKDKARTTKIRIERYKQLVKYLENHPCVDCGETNPLVLDFDHVSGKKINNVSTMALNRFSWESILKEIEKCEVRCANCHRIKTAKITNSVKFRIINKTI